MLSFQNWTNMTFAILSACITFVEFIINCFLSGDKRGSARMAIFIPMLVLSLAQSGIALAVAIYCCKYWCSSSCCYQTPREVMVQQPCMTQSFDVMLSNAQASYHGGYPVTVYPTVSYPHEILSSAPPPYADHHQDTCISTGVAVPKKPMAVACDSHVP